MFKIIKRLVPSKIKNRIKKIELVNKFFIINVTVKNYFYDLRRFLKFSGTLDGFKTKNHHEARIIHAYHNIEKGLSLKNPRIGFGKEKISYLLKILDDYRLKYGWDYSSRVALNVLETYYNFNLKNGLKNEQLYNDIERLKQSLPESLSSVNDGGVVKINKQDIERVAKIDFKSFVNSRYSIRNFKHCDIDINKIKEAVSIARKTPSVCNRQTTRVHVYTGDKKNEVLKYQNGNRGFGENCSAVLIVTSKLDYFMGPNERNQAFIDGGMFSMSLVYALHSLGLGTCCLNLSIEYDVDQELRRVAKIDDSESFIMMIAVGELPDELNVAYSYRKPVDEIISFKQ